MLPIMSAMRKTNGPALSRRSLFVSMFSFLTKRKNIIDEIITINKMEYTNIAAISTSSPSYKFTSLDEKSRSVKRRKLTTKIGVIEFNNRYCPFFPLISCCVTIVVVYIYFFAKYFVIDFHRY